MPNQPQTMTVQVSMVTLYGLFPLVCYGVAAFLFRKFKLDERAYAGDQARTRWARAFDGLTLESCKSRHWKR